MKKIIYLLLLLLVSGIASAGEKLTGDEHKTFYSDKTVVGIHFKNGQQKTYYGADGLVQSQSKDGTKRSGKWWINKKNKRCIKWDHAPKKKCHYTESNSDGTHTLIHGKKGKKLVEMSETLDGNQL